MKKHFILFFGFLVISMIGFSQNEKAFHFTPDTTYLPDGTGASYTTTIWVSGYVVGQTITTLNDFLGICVNMEHSYLGDLEISLTCPDSTTIILEDQGGGGTYLGIPLDYDPSPPGIGFDYCWTPNPDYGVMSIEGNSYSTLPAGTYASYQPLSDLIGCPLNGPWTIIVTDNWAIDDGYIFNWGINFVQNPGCFTMLTGQIFADLNGNDIFDSSDVPMPNIELQANPGPYYGMTDANGYYRIWVDSGSYTVNQIGIALPWQQSFPNTPSSYSVAVTTNTYDTISGFNFANIASYYCPDLSVDVVLGSIGICSYPLVTVWYQNNGTMPSSNTTITVELDNNLTYYSGGNLISQNGNLLTFDVGNVGISQQGHFTFTTSYSCNPVWTGATACVEAHIYPDSSCIPVDSTWDHSSVSVEGECTGDSAICFTIYNTGTSGSGDMQGASEYRIYEDNILVYTSNFQLTGSDSLIVCWPANGSTIRLEADQRPGHPGNSHPQESIELCGNPNNSMGQILVVPQDDYDDFVEVDCQEVVSSLDPNDKQVVPQGLLSQHFIDSTDVMEYTIRFQNTGTAPAQKVVIFDTISDFLDVTTFNPMSASHSYTVDILYSNVIRWTFNNIILPDSGADESASHGYVKFKIRQKQGNSIGTVITNSAAIFFDYNLPVWTNQVFNTIGKMDQIVTTTPTVYRKADKIKVFPNPATSNITFEVNSNNYDIVVFNMTGQQIRKISRITTGSYTMSKGNLKNGIYFYKIIANNEMIGSGKLILTK
ncbi:MAG: hypothetical protein DRP35_07845 [Candidatus Zixiibacteriota bacterium]|nr:MAG: hypothetical protein DRP35_07845 [candidate division Zixibacteria bacterium]